MSVPKLQIFLQISLLYFPKFSTEYSRIFLVFPSFLLFFVFFKIRFLPSFSNFLTGFPQITELSPGFQSFIRIFYFSAFFEIPCASIHIKSVWDKKMSKPTLLRVHFLTLHACTTSNLNHSSSPTATSLHDQKSLPKESHVVQKEKTCSAFSLHFFPAISQLQSLEIAEKSSSILNFDVLSKVK